MTLVSSWLTSARNSKGNTGSEVAKWERVPPIISGMGKGTDLKFGQYIQTSEGPSKQKSIKNFREEGTWAYPGTAQFFSGNPDYLRNW